MTLQSFSDNLIFNDEKVTTSVILETPFSKEIRILMKKGQLMKAHQTAFPIVVHLLKGEINFGVQGQTYHLQTGMIITLAGGIVHDLSALQDSIVRLSLSKSDKVERVEKVISEK